MLSRMGIGVSLILIAAGAILAFAVDYDVSGIEIQTIGWILLVVGIIGALLSLIFWSSWGGTGGRRETSNRRANICLFARARVRVARPPRPTPGARCALCLV